MRKTLILESITALKAERVKVLALRNNLHQRAKELDASGDKTAAEEAYERLLRQDPDNADAWLELGSVYLSLGRLQLALDANLAALKLHPFSARAHHSFGLTLANAGDLNEALGRYQSVIGITAPKNDLIVIEQCCLESTADSPNMLLMLGNVRIAQRRLTPAITAYTEAFRRSESAEAARNIAFAYYLASDESNASLYSGYASFLDGQPEEALRVFRSFPDPAYDDPFFGKTVIRCYLQVDQYADAARVYRKASLNHRDAGDLAVEIAARPDMRGNAPQAISFAEEALRRSPNNLALRYIDRLALPGVYETQEEIGIYRKRFSMGLRELMSDTPLRTPDERLRALTAISETSTFYLAYQNQDDLELQTAYSALVHRIVRSNYPQWTQPIHRPERENERIRVGYISRFLWNHSVGNMHLGWLRHRDRQRFEIFCYHLGNRTDFITSEYRREADHFHYLNDGLESVATRILADALHVLVFLDIGMSASTTQIAALRLAPVQCCSWGHPVTTGLPTIDYFLSGSAMEPDGANAHYSERLIQLPGVGLVYEPIDPPTKPKTREEFGIPPEAVVYISSQSLFKYLPSYDYVFPEIARAVPQAKFVFFLSAALDTWCIERFRNRLGSAFENAGLDYALHCITLPFQDWVDVLGLYVRSDVYLDSIGWSGGNTSIEAIACGLPLVTLPGEFMRGRHTYGFLKLMGIEETIAQTEHDYISIAVRLGKDEVFRKSVRKKIMERRRILFDDTGSVRALEAFYSEAVRLQDQGRGMG